MIELEYSDIPEHLRKFFKPKHQQWIMRNDIIWAKRNGMPESVTDRFSKKHEYFFFITKQEKYHFNLDAIRDNHIWSLKDKRSLIDGGVLSGGKTAEGEYGIKRVSYNKSGKNPGDVSDFWDINTKGSSNKHYATYNIKLISKPILAGCPKGGIILDPFCGTGTTGVLALDLRRRFIGIEGKEEYVKIANKNISLIKSQPSIDFDELIID